MVMSLVIADVEPPKEIDVPPMVMVLLTRPLLGNPVQFVSVPDVGVPNIGVTNVGDVLKTLEPDPVDVVTPVPPTATLKGPLIIVDVTVAVSPVVTNVPLTVGTAMV